jgi:hypothetical protein
MRSTAFNGPGVFQSFINQCPTVFVLPGRPATKRDRTRTAAARQKVGPPAKIRKRELRKPIREWIDRRHRRARARCIGHTSTVAQKKWIINPIH